MRSLGCASYNLTTMASLALCVLAVSSQFRMVGRSGVIILWRSCGSESLVDPRASGLRTLGSETLVPGDVELEVCCLLGIRFYVCRVDKGGVEKDAWLQNHPARRKTSERLGNREEFVIRGTSLCGSMCFPTGIGFVREPCFLDMRFVPPYFLLRCAF